jgi:hypothetical protein
MMKARKLSLAHMGLGMNSVEVLKKFLSKNHFHSLDFSENYIGDEGLKVLS